MSQLLFNDNAFEVSSSMFKVHIHKVCACFFLLLLKTAAFKEPVNRIAEDLGDVAGQLSGSVSKLDDISAQAQPEETQAEGTQADELVELKDAQEIQHVEAANKTNLAPHDHGSDLVPDSDSSKVASDISKRGSDICQRESDLSSDSEKKVSVARRSVQSGLHKHEATSSSIMQKKNRSASIKQATRSKQRLSRANSKIGFPDPGANDDIETWVDTLPDTARSEKAPDTVSSEKAPDNTSNERPPGTDSNEKPPDTASSEKASIATSEKSPGTANSSPGTARSETVDASDKHKSSVVEAESRRSTLQPDDSIDEEILRSQLEDTNKKEVDQSVSTEPETGTATESEKLEPQTGSLKSGMPSVLVTHQLLIFLLHYNFHSVKLQKLSQQQHTCRTTDNHPAVDVVIL